MPMITAAVSGSRPSRSAQRYTRNTVARLATISAIFIAQKDPATPSGTSAIVKTVNSGP